MTIYVTQGQRRYVGGTITELTGKDISSATFKIGLAPDSVTPPTVWLTPDVNIAGTTTANRVLLLLISSTIVAGGSVVTPPSTFYAWGDISDSPEVEPIVLSGPHTAA